MIELNLELNICDICNMPIAISNFFIFSFFLFPTSHC